MLRRGIFVVSTLLMLQACTSATNQVLNKPLTQPEPIAPALQQDYNGLKRVVAIGRFSDETKRGSSFFVDQQNNRLGKQASDILSARLQQSGKFIMLERQDVEALKETSISVAAQKEIGADYILLGSVSEFGRETVSDVGIFSRNKIQRATATVNVRLVNVKTAEVIYSEEATGTATSEANQVFGVGEAAAFNTALDDKAVSAAISKLVANIMNNLLDEPWRSYVLKQNNNELIIAGGASQGITKGSELSVYQPGDKVTNPQTGKTLNLPGQHIGKVRVVRVAGSGDDEISFVVVTEGQLDQQNLSQYEIREIIAQ